MSLPVILRPEAEADIQKIHIDLEQVRAGLGTRKSPIWVACLHGGAG